MKPPTIRDGILGRFTGFEGHNLGICISVWKSVCLNWLILKGGRICICALDQSLLLAWRQEKVYSRPSFPRSTYMMWCPISFEVSCFKNKIIYKFMISSLCLFKKPKSEEFIKAEDHRFGGTGTKRGFVHWISLHELPHLDKHFC